MADRPDVRVRGPATRAGALRLGRDIASGAAQALSGSGPFHIDRLRISVPAGASKEQIAQALSEAIAIERGRRPR